MTSRIPRGGAAAIVIGGLVAVAAIVLILILWGVSIGNQLVGLDEAKNAAWAQVETALQRRFDLIPNLVATVKGYAEHEKEVLEQVTKYRSQWGAAKTPDEKLAAANQMEGTLARLLVVAEQYPQLKADKSFQDLQVQLEGTENRIKVDRDRYNDAVKTYNTAVRSFPGSLIAGMKGLTPSDGYFESAPAAKEAPKVDFSAEKK